MNVTVFYASVFLIFGLSNSAFANEARSSQEAHSSTQQKKSQLSFTKSLKISGFLWPQKLEPADKNLRLKNTKIYRGANSKLQFVEVKIHKNLSREEALSRFKNQLASINASQQTIATPYEGVITQEIRCDPSLQAKFHKDKNGFTIKRSATARQTYRVCREADAQLKAYIRKIYCQGQSIEVRIHYAKHHQLDLGIDCRD